MRRTRADEDRDRGAVMVELALVLPVLLTLLFGIVGFGSAYSAKVSIQGAAREGARSLALGGSADDAKAAVIAAAGTANVTFGTITGCAAGDTSSNSVMTVNAQVQIEALLFTKTLNMSAVAQMRCGL
ncbi:MAG: TadE/TadG family type IV pilus assembly protein [Actinomycetota bacterium]